MNDMHLPKTSLFRGVLLGTLDQHRPCNEGATWILASPRSAFPCLIPSSDLVHGLLSQPLATLWCQLVEWCPDGIVPENSVPVLANAWPDPDDNDAIYHLPHDICPVNGVREGILGLIHGLRIDPLRTMMEHVFQDRDVCARYWKMPASARHHHAFAGGLAAHSLEVARDLADQASLEGHEQDLCIAGGLLHDIGKVWSYTQDMFPNGAARAMGHELVGLSRLERQLQILEEEWPDGAYTMRVLLSGSGRMRTDGSMPSALVARVKAADQRSCEQERSRKAPGRVWTPKTWLPTDAAAGRVLDARLDRSIDDD